MFILSITINKIS